MLPYEELVKELNIANGIIQREEPEVIEEIQQYGIEQEEGTAVFSYDKETAVPQPNAESMLSDLNNEEDIQNMEDISEVSEEPVDLGLLEDNDEYYEAFQDDADEDETLAVSNMAGEIDINQNDFDILEEENIPSASGELNSSDSYSGELNTADSYSGELNSVEQQEEQGIDMGIEGFDIVDESNLPQPEENQEPSLVDMFGEDIQDLPTPPPEEVPEQPADSPEYPPAQDGATKKTMMGMPAPNIDPSQWVQDAQQETPGQEDFPPPPPPQTEQ